MSRRIFVSTGLLALVTVGFIQLDNTPTNAAKAITWVGELQIVPQTNDPDPQKNDRVFPDQVDPAGYYRDYQVLPSDLNNFCVNGDISTDGTAFFRLDRKQGFANGLWCNQQPEGYKARQYTLILQDLAACGQLGLPLDQLNGTACKLVSPVWPNAQLQPHIFAGGVFKNKATTTPVDFDFTPGTAYRVVTDQDAPIVVLSSDLKMVRYTGTAHLVFTGGATIGGSFPLPFTMIIRRIQL